MSWTINGQPPSTGCQAANAATVRLTVGGSPAEGVACATGSRTYASLTPGQVQVVADLLDGNNATLNSFNQPVTVEAGKVANLQIAFTTGSTQGGSVGFTWTVGGQAASTGCPSGAQVTFEATTAPATPPAALSVACSQGTAQMDNLPVGNYVFKATLGATPPVVNENLGVTVVQGQVAQVPSFDFAAAAAVGSATVQWTINGGQNCPAATSGNPTVGVVVSGGASTPTVDPVDCSLNQVQIPNLTPGAGYTFQVTLNDPAHPTPNPPVTGTATVEIQANQDAQVTIDMVCCFCPNAAQSC